MQGTYDLLPLSQKASREAFDKVDPLFAGL